MSFWVKTNRWVKLLFPNYVWDIPNDEKKVFLTFDDGPTPEITEWVLAQLEHFNAKATFFCIGNNIEKHPAIFEKVLAAGHAIGNHTYHHVKGWKTSNDIYLDNVIKCSVISRPFLGGNSQKGIGNSNSQLNTEHCELFRPPYGKIKNAQGKALRKLGYKIIMWDVISMDYDANITPEQCLANVLNNIQTGSIIVFHDSVKAQKNLKYALPKTLAYLQEKGFVCDVIA